MPISGVFGPLQSLDYSSSTVALQKAMSCKYTAPVAFDGSSLEGVSRIYFDKANMCGPGHKP